VNQADFVFLAEHRSAVLTRYLVEQTGPRPTGSQSGCSQ
jgi:hypothetical protein